MNNNRAVYRSRLLLDEDLAARSASQARIYRDLGFEQLALVEGWKSVNADPSSYSAHRLLADSYSAVPRNEIARVSELLQSQLLQPLNITPIQPQLSESSPLILEGAGPSALAFNEFNPLFVRDGVKFLADGVVGGNDTRGEDMVVAGIHDWLSYSVGQFHFETDGFRENNDLEQDIYNVFLQGRLTPDLSVQTEYRHTEASHGDLGFNGDLHTPDLFRRRDVRTNSIRLGLNYRPAPHSNVIFSGIYQDEEEAQQIANGGNSFDIRFDTQEYLSEAQYLFRSARLNLVGGASRYDADSRLLGFPSKSRHTKGYVYSYIRYPQQVNWIIGASYDSLESSFLQAFGPRGDFDHFNPKLGATWNVTRDTTLRMAAFRVLKRDLLADQTIEPTQVAGFNQLFDDPGGTESTRYGIAVDQQFSSTFFGGVEASHRDLEVPLIDRENLTEWEEDSYRAYLNWAFHPRASASVEYEREQFEVADLLDGIPNTDTQYVPASLSFYHPSGFFARARTTYVDQEVESAFGESGDSFFLTDIGIGYRLPQRYGIVNIEVKNLFDQDFSFQDSSSRTAQLVPAPPPFLPERAIFAGVTLSF